MLFWSAFALLSLPFIRAEMSSQIPMGNPSSGDSFVPLSSPPTLADLLTTHSASSIFYDYAREIDGLNLRLSDTSGVSRSTLLVPVNKAVIALPRKPHQSPEEGHVEITEDQSRTNVERWVSAHIIPESPIQLGSGKVYPTLLEGASVSFMRIAEEGEVWQQYVVNSDIRIVGRAEASNGELYLIDGVLGA